MLAYIIRRLLLIIPTLFGILLINFIIIQAAPGGPVEQAIAKLEGFEGVALHVSQFSGVRVLHPGAQGGVGQGSRVARQDGGERLGCSADGFTGGHVTLRSC